MSNQNENNTIFLKNSKGSKNINFLIKFIYNILYIIKKLYKILKFFFFTFKQTFSNPIVSTVNQKQQKTYKKKSTKTTIQKKKGKNKNYIKVKLLFSNM